MLRKTTIINNAIHPKDPTDLKFESKRCISSLVSPVFPPSPLPTEESDEDFYDYSENSLVSNRENILSSNILVPKSPPDTAVENSYGLDVGTTLVSTSFTENSQICRAEFTHVKPIQLILAADCSSTKGDQWLSVLHSRTGTKCLELKESQTSDDEYGFCSLKESKIFMTLHSNDNALVPANNNQNPENILTTALETTNVAQASVLHLAEEESLSVTLENEAPTWEYVLENQDVSFLETNIGYRDNNIFEANKDSEVPNQQIPTFQSYQNNISLMHEPGDGAKLKSSGLEVDINVDEDSSDLRKDNEISSTHFSSPVLVSMSAARETLISVECTQKSNIKFASVHAGGPNCNIMDVNIDSCDILSESVKEGNKGQAIREQISTEHQIRSSCKLNTEANSLDSSKIIRKDNARQNIRKRESIMHPKQIKDRVRNICYKKPTTSLRNSSVSPSLNSKGVTLKSSTISTRSSKDNYVLRRQIEDAKLQMEEERKRKECFQAWVQQKEAQKNWERILKEREMEEKRKGQETRSREDSEKAFKEWLRRKNNESKRAAKEARENLKLHEHRQRSAAMVRAIQKINLNNYFMDARFS